MEARSAPSRQWIYSSQLNRDTPATSPKKSSMELDTSGDFLSLIPTSHNKSAPVTRSSAALDGGFTGHDDTTGHSDMRQDEGSGVILSPRTRGQRMKQEVSYAAMEPKTSSPVTEEKDSTSRFSRFQREGNASSGKQQADVPDEVEGSSTPKRCRFNLQSSEVEEEEEKDCSVRRSSRITRYKLDSRNQSVLYDRLITNAAEAVLQKMDDMKKMRRRLKSRDRDSKDKLGVYTRGQMRRSLSTKLEIKIPEEENQGVDEEDHDKEEEQDREVDDDEEEEEDGEDEEDDHRRYDFRQRKTAVRYQAPQDEPREPRKRIMYYKDHSSPTRCRFRSTSTAPRSPYYRRRTNSTAEAVLQKMDDMKKMRRRLKSRDRDTKEKIGVYTRGQMRRSLRTKLQIKIPEEENQGVDDEDHDKEGEQDRDVDEEEEEDDDDEDGEDEEEDNHKRYDLRQRKPAVRYQAPQDEPREPRKRSMYYKDHSSPTRCRFRSTSTAPRSPYHRRRTNRRRNAIHSGSSSSDDEKFQRRRSKSRSRPVNRCLPMNLVKEDLLGIQKDRMKIGASLADWEPMCIDRKVGFGSIGGLSRHISSLKEMVVFPLLYPEVFERFKIQPPRGCLFYGPPGTGKTLVARALANECSQGERKVSFFMRKGADCLNKWVGESERQLRLLFDKAFQMRPSIIFFDEIDGLAPVRSSRQDQIHSSIVSTLLALMDGLDARGEIVVIGATNRLDTIDPALRRPGRFDREFLFGLPDREARKDILKIHTRQWTPPPSDTFLEELGDKCVGYCGADLKAVCSEAALCALRRCYPQIYSSSEKLVLDVNSIAITNIDFICAMSKMVPTAKRAVVSPAKSLIPAIRPLLKAPLQKLLHMVSRVFPHAEEGLKRKREQDGACGVPEDDLMFSEDEDICLPLHTPLTPRKMPAVKGLLNLNRSVLSQPTSYRPRLLLEGRPGSGQSTYLGPAVLHALEKFTVYTLDIAVLFGASAAAPEETCAQIFHEATRTSPSILYIPQIGQWWDTVGPALKATFLSLLSSIPAFSPILLMATCDLQYDQLSMEVQDLFRVEYGEVFRVQVPTSIERRNFFEDLILNQAAKAPASKKKAVLRALEVLPVAPPPPPCQLTEEETQKLEKQEEDTLRELRLFLRDVTNRLFQDKRFKTFTKPVDLEEVRGYAEVIKKPMDLSTVLSKIDLHRYGAVKEFVQDVDLIWQNALEYNPERDPSGRQIRHRACALRVTIHAIISDELNEDFEKICEEIKASRSTRGSPTTTRLAPSFYQVLPKQPNSLAKAEITDTTPQRDPAGATAAVTRYTTPPAFTTPKNTVQRKRRRKSRWAAGVCVKKRSAFSPHLSRDEIKLGSNEVDGDDEEEAEKDTGAEVTEGEVDIRSGPAEGQEGSPEQEGRKGTLSANTRNILIETERGDHHEQSITAERGETQEQRLATAQNRHAEPMEVEATETSTTEADSNTARSMRRRTRSVKISGLQQQRIDVDKAMQIPVKDVPVLVVDILKEMLEKVVTKTDSFEVYKLEKLYALLCQSIYRHRRDFDKTALIQEMDQEIEDFF
ncbi:ATPase family AAA domain-containing protein 2-like [Limanda limanda]|uniref:ATPase family AAA domain-containing protein 2-like n=1 Tax=Limanda limanda TaxID=27771 RepID=UPI0029C61E5A|nr:ATPase family AAA domain-containing protein 2-like [Limanda limanda]